MSFCLSASFMAAGPPQAGTCCGCQPEGLKFLVLAGTFAEIRGKERRRELQ